MTALQRLIGDTIAGRGNALIEEAVFGTDDAGAIARSLEDLIVEHLPAPPADGLFYAASAGCVAGVRLVNGGEVVIKAFQSRWTAEFLRCVAAVQDHLADAGFPCPRTITGPLESGTATVLIERLLPDPGPVPIVP